MHSWLSILAPVEAPFNQQGRSCSQRRRVGGQRETNVSLDNISHPDRPEVFQVGFEHRDAYNGFEHDPEEAARARVRLLRELAANRESLVATHLSPCSRRG